MYPLKDEIVSFLQSKREDVLEDMMNQAGLTVSNHLSVDTMKENAATLLDIMFDVYRLSSEELEHSLDTLAKKMVSEQLQARTDFSEFIECIQKSRAHLLQELRLLLQGYEDFFDAVFHMNHSYDIFTNKIVTYYTRMKEKEIEDKNKRIDATHDERLTLLGQMTSSFVHEFRNPLTAIHGFVQLLKAENPELPYLDIILSELDQLKFRISQFLMLSRKETFEKEASIFSLNELIDQVTSFIYPRLLEVNVDFQQNLKGELIVEGYQEEIRQVLINIIFNAVDILVGQSDARINIEGYEESNNIIIKTSNNGPPIPEYLLENIFEPFVTTKKSGTGLGLYVCREIIEKHKGKFFCSSQSDWTTFTISLPSAIRKEP